MISNKQKEILEQKLTLEIGEKIMPNLELYCKLFKEYNSHTNLISKNDEKFLFEKHIFDSLALNLFFKKHKIKNLLDIGTGGGFPSVIIAIFFPEIKVFAMDSIKKKLNFIELIKTELKLTNLEIIHARAENVSQNMKENFDVVTCRAVSELKNLFPYSAPYLKKSGFFVAFKSKNFQEEINNAQNVIKKLHFKLNEIIDYNLPLEENFERKLLVFEKK